MTGAPVVWLVVPLLAACRPPAPPPPPKPAPTISDDGGPGSRAFVRLRELAGSWAAGDAAVSIDVIGKTSALVQRGGFVAIWYPDGEAIAVAVFLEDGHHARLRSTAIREPPTGELGIDLAMVEVGNIVLDAPVARAATLEVAPDNDRMTQRWVFGDGTTHESPIELVLTRAATPPPPPLPAVLPTTI